MGAVSAAVVELLTFNVSTNSENSVIFFFFFFEIVMVHLLSHIFWSLPPGLVLVS